MGNKGFFWPPLWCRPRCGLSPTCESSPLSFSNGLVCVCSVFGSAEAQSSSRSRSAAACFSSRSARVWLSSRPSRPTRPTRPVLLFLSSRSCTSSSSSGFSDIELGWTLFSLSHDFGRNPLLRLILEAQSLVISSIGTFSYIRLG